MAEVLTDYVPALGSPKKSVIKGSKTTFGYHQECRPLGHDGCCQGHEEDDHHCDQLESFVRFLEEVVVFPLGNRNFSLCSRSKQVPPRLAEGCRFLEGRAPIFIVVRPHWSPQGQFLPTRVGVRHGGHFTWDGLLSVVTKPWSKTPLPLITSFIGRALATMCLYSIPRIVYSNRMNQNIRGAKGCHRDFVRYQQHDESSKIPNN